MGPSFDSTALFALVAVVVIDIVLSGDNAVVLGLIVSGLPEERRRRVIFLGVALATLMRIGLAFIAVPILNIIGLTLAGGVLLLWVAWKIWREVRKAAVTPANAIGSGAAPRADVLQKTSRQAIVQIALADFAMSLDNVLGVAGAAREHPWVLVIGLALSVAMMAFAAGFVAQLLDRYDWLIYLGLAVVTIVALRMIWRGGADVLGAAWMT